MMEATKDQKEGEALARNVAELQPYEAANKETSGQSDLAADFVDVVQKLSMRCSILSLIGSHTDLSTAMDRVFEEIGTVLHWGVGLFWQPDPLRKELVLTNSWFTESCGELSRFVQESKMYSFKRGAGKPGKVWSSGQSQWSLGLEEDKDFQRIDVARKSGLRSGLWIPVVAETNVLGVLELLRKDECPPGEDMIEELANIGEQLGSAIQRFENARELSFNIQKYQTFIAQSSEGMWRFEIDPPVPVELPEKEQIRLYKSNSYLAECNKAMARMYGFEEPTDLIGLSARELMVGDSPVNEEYFRAFVRSGYKLSKAETMEADRFGHLRIFLNNVVGIIEDGKLVRTWGTQCDITDSRRVSDQLKRSEEKYRDIFDLSPQPMWIISRGNLKILDVNQAAMEQYGYSKEEFLSLSALQLNPPNEQNEAAKLLRTEASTRPSSRSPLTHIRKDGSHMLVELVARSILSGGRPARLILINDVTERIRIEADKEMLRRDLERAKNAAEEASRLKSAFLANMSHEIRTPLGAVLGFTDLLFDPATNPEDRQTYQGTIRRNGELLTTLIDDILDLSKVESGYLTIRNLKFSARELIDEIRSAMIVKAETKGLVINTSVDSAVPDSIGSDPMRLRQILINLVGNAIKFTESGSIDLRATYEVDPTTRRKYLKFEVTDTGIGITPEQCQRLFQPFVQADESMTRIYGGTGLGLALSRRLAKLLGGEVGLVRSGKKGGSTFSAVIEDRIHEAAEPHKFSSRSLGNKSAGPGLQAEDLSILVVDDSPDNQQLIKRILTKQGATVELACNGLEAIEKAKEGHHDLILMDIQMPKLDGYSATSRLRESGYTKPIIALTAHAMSEAKERSFAVGCSGYLSKPIITADLFRTISEHC